MPDSPPLFARDNIASIKGLIVNALLNMHCIYDPQDAEAISDDRSRS